MRDQADIRLASAAARQHTVVGLADVRAAQLDKHAVHRRVQAGRLHPMFPGSWCVGHRPIGREPWWMAAVLSVAPDARLDGPSACQLYDVHDRKVGRVHVLSARRRTSSRRLVVRCARELPPMRRRKGIPVVPIEEALLGLAASDATDRDVRRAIRQAQVKKLTTYAKLRRHALRAAGRQGVTRFRQLVGGGAAPTRSHLEDAALDLLRRYGLDPRCNLNVDGREADLVAGGVIIELDSEEFHDNPVTAQDDALKHDHWTSRGRAVERLTWDDIHVTPVNTIRRIARASRATRSSPPPA